MAAVTELIRENADGSLSFGDYTKASKSKLDNFSYQNDLYKVKTFKEITKLERNGLFVYESVPGTAVENFTATADQVAFTVEGPDDAEVTLELEPETEYDIKINEVDAGTMKTNLGGKLTVSVELGSGAAVKIVVNRA